MLNRKSLFLSLFFLFPIIVCSQTFRVATYNCENAFDTIHDVGKNDTEFLPDGNRRWTRGRMFTKLKNIGKVIMSIDSIRPVDVICLNEVENDTVLTYLTRNTALSRVGYNYIMTNSPDERGIDVALLYSPLTFHLISYDFIRPRIVAKTRDVLHACGWVDDHDTIDIFAVHLPSKLNGRTSEKNRMVIARQIMSYVDSLNHIRKSPCIVVLGDFNDGPNSSVVKEGFKELTDLMTSDDHSYKYQGQWGCIDQILVNDAMKQKNVNAEVAVRPFMLEPDDKFSGLKPKRTFVGWKYNHGFSDHLPVTASFSF